jgi:phosphoglucosamine mutase
LNIFGSDGFRCKFGTEFMTFEFITKFSNALAKTYTDQRFRNPIIISRDTRSSGVLIENLVSTILLARGIDVVLADVLPTPGLSRILNEGEYSIGIMITASHNPHHDNGIKLFGSSGFKLSSKIEKNIESYILNKNLALDCFGLNAFIGKKVILDNAFKQYIDSILGIPERLSQKKTLIDCSNGAYSKLSSMYGDNNNLTFINDKPDGSNINLNCGALHADALHKSLHIDNYDFGIAFDGDGDRAVFVSREYGVIEAEKLVLLFFRAMQKQSLSKKIVISEISNLALKHNLEELGGCLIETEVGDRFVVDAVEENQAMFGCEPSGHFYFPGGSKSMDGFVAMQKFLKLLDSHENNIDDDLINIKHYQRVQENIDIKEFPDLDLDKIKEGIAQFINIDIEKLIIRKSMWDPVIRIYYDYSSRNNFDYIKKELYKLLSNMNKTEPI